MDFLICLYSTTTAPTRYPPPPSPTNDIALITTLYYLNICDVFSIVMSLVRKYIVQDHILCTVSFVHHKLEWSRNKAV